MIASRSLQLHTPSMRPCERSQSKPFSSTILESQSSTEAQITKTAQPPESTFEKSHDSKENAHLSSLRDTAPAAAWQSISTKNAKADSKQNAQKSQKVDSSSAQNLHDQADTLLSKKAGKKPVLRLFATTLLGFLHFAGVNAIYFYIAQGISSSLLFPILRHFPPLIWWVKLPLAFCINLGLCVVFVWGLIALFSTLHTICHKLTLMANRAKLAFVP